MPTLTFRAEDIPDGGMRGYELDDRKILILRDGDDIRAFEGSCPHAGAPLAKGVRCAGRVVCPWHHAAFAVDDGSLIEPPATEGLPRFDVSRNGDECIVDPEKTVPSQHAGPGGKEHIVIIGAGAGAFMAAHTLRAKGHQGEIVLLSPEGVAPYDRTMLSKAYLAGKLTEDKLALGGPEWADKHRITIRQRSAVALDRDAHQVILDGDERLSYDKLIVAAGAQPTDGGLKGSHLEGVYVLRSLEEARRLRAAAKAKRVVIVGSGFIAMEAAASLSGDDGASSVTVLGKSDHVMASMLGPEPAAALTALHRKHGVDIRNNVQVEAIIGDSDAVTSVQLKDAPAVPADIVLLGLGVHVDHPVLASLTNEAGDIAVGAHMEVAPDIQVIGDIVSAPTATGRVQVQHWRVAMQEGLVAAGHVVSSGTRPDMSGRVPFFWTMQYGKSIRYVGHAPTDAPRHVWGDPAKLSFIEFSFGDGRVVAAAGCGRDTEIAAIEECLRLGIDLDQAEVRDGPFDLVARLLSRHTISD